MMKHLIARILLVMMIMMLVTSAYAQDVMPCADEVFHRASAALYSDRWITYNCVTISTVAELKITSCWLQKKIDDSWVWQKSLPTGGVVGRNTDSILYDVDYSSYITEAGTYRVGFTADADGHAITRYSNERTFSN